MAAMTRYTAIAEREGSWWVITVPELDITTQARRIDLIEHMARDLVAIWLEVGPDSFDVDVSVHVPKEWQVEVDRLKQAQARAKHAEEVAAKQARAVARRLKAQGLPVRDVGAVLGVSPQRVSQLLKVS